MPKRVSPPELTLRQRPKGTTLTRWLYDELRGAIADGRLRAGTRLPASRDFAQHYKLSRGTVVTVFEQLEIEGFLRTKVGAGTWVSNTAERPLARRQTFDASRKLPSPMGGLKRDGPAHPFRCYEPAVDQFPRHIWARLASRRMRGASADFLSERDAQGHKPLRDALANYLAVSRGVKCSADQIVITSGVQQALDLVARALLKRGDSIWMEDPGYFGAVTAFRNAGVNVVPVPVDEQGISVTSGRKRARNAKAAYLTPAHQFPLGVMMPAERRLAILDWAREAGAFLIEDDYDGEYRFEGSPAPCLQSLDRNDSVILMGTFNKILFSSLRVGYIVLPPALLDPVLAFRFGLDQNSVALEQGVLCDFIVEGHLGRYVRRTRELYGARLAVLQEEIRRRLGGLLEVPPIQAGLSTVAYLRNGVASRRAESAAASYGVETMAIDRFRIERKDVEGLLLGFAAFDERQIRKAAEKLEAALTGLQARRETA
ncbi:MAG TPA: PLP-dependent aminotransferase family protein [Bryobacteraceae bacterium]|nr:PLP-dependent aminotransferase family protein [Bryobacteraceae bacterium]